MQVVRYNNDGESHEKEYGTHPPFGKIILHIQTHTHIYIYIYIYVCVYVCIRMQNAKCPFHTPCLFHPISEGLLVLCEASKKLFSTLQFVLASSFELNSIGGIGIG